MSEPVDLDTDYWRPPCGSLARVTDDHVPGCDYCQTLARRAAAEARRGAA